MKIGESIKKRINDIFGYNYVKAHKLKDIDILLSSSAHGTEVKLIPEYDGIKVKPIDDLHDEVVLEYEDYEVSGVMTWRESTSGVGYSFIDYK